MSNRYTYRCDAHNPPIWADSEEMGDASNSMLEKDLKRRVLFRSIPEFLWVEFEVDFPRHYRWLNFHRNCHVSLIDENGLVVIMQVPPSEVHRGSRPL